MRRYEARFAGVPVDNQCFVVLTQNGAEQVVRHSMGAWVPPEPIHAAVLSWSDVLGLAVAASRGGRLAERHLATDLAAYLPAR